MCVFFGTYTAILFDKISTNLTSLLLQPERKRGLARNYLSTQTSSTKLGWLLIG